MRTALRLPLLFGDLWTMWGLACLLFFGTDRSTDIYVDASLWRLIAVSGQSVRTFLCLMCTAYVPNSLSGSSLPILLGHLPLRLLQPLSFLTPQASM
jgi:hypothetical protein